MRVDERVIDQMRYMYESKPGIHFSFDSSLLQSKDFFLINTSSTFRLFQHPSAIDLSGWSLAEILASSYNQQDEQDEPDQDERMDESCQITQGSPTQGERASSQIPRPSPQLRCSRLLPGPHRQWTDAM